MYLLFRILTSRLPIVGTKYDLDNKIPNRSGQNFKSGEDMIEMYKELCAGIWYLNQNVDVYISLFSIQAIQARC